jgi:hypothetical protein
MSKLKIPPFYIGQKVVYITGLQMPKNSIHVVSDTFLSKCGCWVIEINNKKLTPFTAKTNRTRCLNCGNAYNSHNNDYTGWASNSFRAFEEKKLQLLTFIEIKEKEKEEILTLN